jgi:hypothetical protein
MKNRLINGMKAFTMKTQNINMIDLSQRVFGLVKMVKLLIGLNLRRKIIIMQLKDLDQCIENIG